MPGPQAVAVVTVNWNGGTNTLRCLDALRESVGADWHLVIVDNASTDGSAERLRGLGGDVTLIESPINGGWTGGNNLGVRSAITAGYRFIFVLNNDAFVAPDTIAVLLATHRALGGDVVLGPIHVDEADRLDFIGTHDDETGFPYWRPTDGLTPEMLDAVEETSSIKGAGLFLTAADFDRVGPFDDRFYLNFDETDWCYAAREKGLRLFMCAHSRIRHVGSATIGGLESPLHIYFMTRNALLFAEKHCTPRQRLAHLRRLYWDARGRARGHRPGRRWIAGFLRSREADERAFRRALVDYARRRFGDCPAIIRQLNRRS